MEERAREHLDQGHPERGGLGAKMSPSTDSIALLDWLHIPKSRPLTPNPDSFSQLRFSVGEKIPLKLAGAISRVMSAENAMHLNPMKSQIDEISSSA
jgi:hypothetical protein